MESSRILIIGLNWPEPGATAAGVRMMELIRCFLKWNCQVTFASTANETEHSANLQMLGVEKQKIVLNHNSFDSFIQSLKPEMVVFDRFITEEQFGWRVAQYTPDAVRILDTEDLHSLRHSRELAFKSDEDFSINLWLQNEVTKREIASIYRSDLSLIISSYEMQLLQEQLHFPAHSLMHLPFMLDSIDEKEESSWLPFEAREHFVFVGNGKHAPNTDAIIWLEKELWPLIKAKLPKANIHIYGTYLPETILKLNDPDTGFLVHGRADDLTKVLKQAKVNLAALRFGAGIKGKVVKAMSLGTPTAMTSIAGEGIYELSKVKTSPGFDKNAFVVEAVRLYSDKEAWKSMQRKGVTVINERFNRLKIQPAFKWKLEDILRHKKHYRTENFVGGMLLHHSMASSKYLAKWIASKNSKNEVTD